MSSSIQALFIINRHGSLVYQMDLSSSRGISSNDKIRIASIFHSVSAIASAVSPNKSGRGTGDIAFLHPTGIDHISTSDFSIFAKQSLTGLKLLLVVGPTFPEKSAQELLSLIYTSYSDYVLKDPFYALDMPIRCSLFDKNVRAVLAVGPPLEYEYLTCNTNLASMTNSLIVDTAVDGLLSSILLNLEWNDAKVAQVLPRKVSDEALWELGNLLEADFQSIESSGKQTVKNVLQTIVARCECLVDRFCVSGSIGHQPEHYADNKVGFDITVFVQETNEMQKQQSSTIESHCEQVYKCICDLCGSCSGLYLDHIGCHFAINGFPMHVAVVPSMGHKMHMQRQCVWDELDILLSRLAVVPSVTQADIDRYSISLHESLASFMHLGGDPALHALVRLGRLWRQKVLIESGCNQLSTLAAVLVMIRCIEVEKGKGTVSLVNRRNIPTERIFADFLEYFAEFQSVGMSWPQFYVPCQTLIGAPSSPRVKRSTPYIMDPVNPHRNLIANITPETIEWITGAAKFGLEQIRRRATLKELFSPIDRHRHRGV